MPKPTSKVTIKGSKRDGYIITITDRYGWKGDLQISSYDELVLLGNEIARKV